VVVFFFFSSRRRHTRFSRDWSSDVCSSDLVMLWRPEASDPSLLAWGLTQLRALGMIFLIILALMALLRILKALGIERLMHALLAPLLRVIGIGREASNVTIIGFTLGRSIGAGLLIREARTGQMSRGDIIRTLGFLGLCHSIIE